MILPFVGELLAHVGRHPAVESAVDLLRRGTREVRLSGLTPTAKALLVAHAAHALNRPAVFLVSGNTQADAAAEPLRFFYRALSGKPAAHVAVLPAYDVMPWQGLSPHPDIAEARAAALWRFATGQARVLVVPIAAAAMRLRESQHYAALARTLAREETVALDELLDHLVAVGYERHETVEMPGHFAVRGGIVDVFSPEAARPVRLELFGDTLESLREFDPNTQRSVQPLNAVTLLPLNEVLRRGELIEELFVRRAGSGAAESRRLAGVFPGWEFEAARLEPPAGTLFDLSPGFVVLEDEPQLLEQALARQMERAGQLFRAAQTGARPADEDASPRRYFLAEDEWAAARSRAPRLLLEQLPLEHGAGDGAAANSFVLMSQPTIRYHGNVTAFMAEVRGRLRAGDVALAAAANTGELERMADLCHEYELAFQLGEAGDDATLVRLAGDSSAGSVPALTLVKAPLSEGVSFPDLNLWFYGSSDLFETLPAPERPRKRPQTASFFSDFSDLKPGDFIVHVDHGIGQFDGLRQLDSGGSMAEFMQLRYAEEARLYVPLARLDLIQKYRSLEGGRPPLDRLGGTLWTARKQRVKKSVSDLADKLLKLYADRKAGEGHAFPPDTAWQREFEDAFEFEETPDQNRAIADVKKDMERALPMDRLLCGDVGYGKTEVAMRAAFKALQDSRQVAVLAPTTVLVFQHYETFRRRFGAFPVRVEMLSRFRNAKEQKQIIADAEAGKVDVVIGTHRLLSRDVKFANLGLLVVDEEQRFGVAHKERIKEMRRNVDVLTMSATPIPRTLHMSLVGLRDMSVIETPPKDRLAIQTVVAPFREQLVQSALESELARNGQVYFVHNRVESIFSMAALLQRLAPRAKVVVGHGQMGEKELESVMLKFVRGEADILVSTTIIENGLDIPRANTMIINRADRLGLSELYQLRGRVGRSNQRAYAYLLVPNEAALPDLARRRLSALREFSELGAGFRIAALDLELRGAGNMLGAEQHGHVNAVGFDLYTQMLERAVAERKGEAVETELRATLNLGLEIRIPPEYIPSENLRLRTYKRISAVASDDERVEVRRELADRFGPPPRAVENLLEYAVLKALAERLGVASIERRGEIVAVKFYEQASVAPEKLVAVVRKGKGMKLDPTGVLWVPLAARRVAANQAASAKGKAAVREAEPPAPVTETVRNVLLQLQV